MNTQTVAPARREPANSEPTGVRQANIRPPVVVELDQLRKTYVSAGVPVHAVRGVSLCVRRGEFVAIMGASGSGKSTLMNILGALDRPSEGTYRLDGVD